MKTAIKPSKLGSTYGVLFGFIMVLIFVIQQFVPGMTPSRLSIINIVVLGVGLILVPIVLKKQNGGLMSFGQGLGSNGMLIIVSTIISALFIYLYVKFVDDFYLEALKEARIEKLSSRMSEVKARQLIASSGQFFSAEFIMVPLVISKFAIGFILTLIIVAVLKKQEKDSSLDR